MKNNQKKGNNSNKKNDQPKDVTKKKRFKKKPKWMFEKPKKADLHKAKEQNGSNWYWCGVDTDGQCEAYRIHAGKECEGKSFNARTKRGNDNYTKKIDDDSQPSKKAAPNNDKKKSNSKPLKLAKALAATVVEQDHYSDSDAS